MSEAESRNLANWSTAPEREAAKLDAKAGAETQSGQLRDADKIQLYTLGTPNGLKISIALEELQLPYVAHKVDLSKDQQHSPEFLAVNPNGKIPAIVIPNFNGEGRPLQLWESGAILLYLAESTGKLMSQEPRERLETIKWLFFQCANVGPMFGQYGHFAVYAKEDVPYAKQRYLNETKRLLGVLEGQLRDRQYLAGPNYSIADVATFPWVDALNRFYGEATQNTLSLSDYPSVKAWLQRCLARPAVQRGMQVCAIK